jgi:hypothetical protein
MQKIAVMTKPKLVQWYHFQADLTLPDGSFKVSMPPNIDTSLVLVVLKLLLESSQDHS